MKLFLGLVSVLPIARSSPVYSPRELTIEAESHNPPAPLLNDLQEPDSRSSRDIGPDVDYTASDIAFPASGISPWSDSGRSETLDYQPTWRYCPKDYLNCHKCFRDPRCRPPSSPRPHKPKHPLRSHLLLPESSEPAALTGPQLAHSEFPEEASPKRCMLRRCGNEEFGDCGTNATCDRGFCKCARHLKAVDGYYMVRGWKFPETLSVWVDPGTACGRPCEGLWCSEVERDGACFEEQMGKPIDVKEPLNTDKQFGSVSNPTSVAPSQQEGEGLDVDLKGSGPVQVPGAVVDRGSTDSVA